MEEEVEAAPKKETETTSQTQEQKQPEHNERQRAIQSVPKRKTSRQQSTSGERNQSMANQNSSKNVVSMSQTQSFMEQESSKMCLFEPRVFSDTQDIADELKNRRATLVNLQRIDKVSAKRIIDFLSGTVYAIGGDIQRVGADIFLCTPDNVEVAGSITDEIESMDQHFE